MTWTPAANAKCPECGNVVRTRKPKGEPVNCNKCKAVFPHGGRNRVSSETHKAKCPRCDYITNTNKAPGSICTCTKCYTPVVVR